VFAQTKTKRRWISENVDDHQVRALAESEGLPYLAALVLFKRGYRNAESVSKFLNPSYEHLHDASELPDIEPAVARLLRAIQNQERVLVHGDYDVDGITGAALLVKGLSRLGVSAEYYLPHRMRDGYGFSARAIQVARDHRVSLILTVDCGITSVAEVRMAKDAGIDVVITDHHEPGEELPQAAAVIDPKRRDSTYPFAELAGVGVAYKLLAALSTQLGRSPDELGEDLDLVALGTIADVVPLVDENRVFARFGLQRIQQTNKPGLSALLDISRLAGKAVSASDVGFRLAPRLNASGRVAEAMQGLRLLVTEDRAEAESLAIELDEHNRNRKQIQEVILDQAMIAARRQIRESDPRVLVCYQPGWHEGVIGIVASRLVEEYYRPAILFADKNGSLKGSGRSIRGFNLYEALASSEKHLVSFGGHAAAAGMVAEANQLAAFTLAINKHASSYPDSLFEPRLHVDADVVLSDLDAETMACFEKFRPYGMGNPQPCFVSRGLEVVGTPRVFARRHLKFMARQDKITLPVVAYGQSELILELEQGRRDALDIAFRVDQDSYWGKKRMQLIAKDINLKERKEK
jgi:single-stranded-DNA-specific exonuclease